MKYISEKKLKRHSPDQGCRLYLSFLPFLLTSLPPFSQLRLPLLLLVSGWLKWPFTCLSRAVCKWIRTTVFEYFLRQKSVVCEEIRITWELNLKPQPSTMHRKGLLPPWDRTCLSNHRREHEVLPCTLHPCQWQTKLSPPVCVLMCAAYKRTQITWKN